MNVCEHNPPRKFAAGARTKVEIRHCADVTLEADEQVTFTDGSGRGYDVVRKSWGYYAAPSLNGRLPRSGLSPALVRNSQGKVYLLFVESGREADFHAYIEREEQQVLCWLDRDDHIRTIVSALEGVGDD